MSGLFIVFFAVFLTNEAAFGDKLVSTIVLFRHGDRTPTKTYKNDPYKDPSYWPAGWGQLTNRGKLRQYELGKWLRQRYDGFLSKKYQAKDIYVLSTDIDRTMMSAQAALAGLYPPAKGEWNHQLGWQPIPVHTVPSSTDNLLAVMKPCLKFYVKVAETMMGDHFRKIHVANRKLYEYIARNSGEVVLNFLHVLLIYDTLKIENELNYTLPDWTDGIFPDKLRSLAMLSFILPTYNEDLAKFQVGPLFDYMITHFRSTVGPRNSSDVPRKMLMLSAHDVNIVSILNALGIFDGTLPPYSSALLFELYRSKVGRYYVKLFYKLESNEAIPLTLNGCDSNCEYGKFLGMIKPLMMTPKEWNEACKTIISEPMRNILKHLFAHLT